MTRRLLSFCWTLALLALLPAGDAAAVELPVRKAGLWEMKVVRSGSPVPDMTMQHCTDAGTDKEMSAAAAPVAKDMCSKQDIQKTATGYVSDSVCSVAGISITSHAEIVGDFNSAYTVKSPRTVRAVPPANRAIPRPQSRQSGLAPASPIRRPAIS